MQNPRLSANAWGLLFLLAVVWSFAYLFNRINLTELPVLTAALGRVLFAAITLWIVVLALRVRVPGAFRNWCDFAVVGLLNNALPFALILSGQNAGVDSGLAAILVGTTPLFSAFLASMLVNDEQLTVGRVGGILFGLGGLSVLIGPDALGGLGSNIPGQLLIVGGALSYAFAAVYSRRFRGMSPLVAATGQLSCSSLILLPVVAWLDAPWRLDPSIGVWAALLTLAVVSTAGAYILYFRILSTAGATNLLLVTLLVPVGAVAWGALFYTEPITLQMIGGAALIFLGLLIIDGRPVAAMAGRLRRTG